MVRLSGHSHHLIIPTLHYPRNPQESNQNSGTRMEWIYGKYEKHFRAILHMAQLVFLIGTFDIHRDLRLKHLRIFRSICL